MDHTRFDKQGFDDFLANDRAGPIDMLNLLKLRGQALYEDGRAATGAQAYAAYGRESAAVFARVGGRIIWRGHMEQMLIGPDRHWDLCFIARYPGVQAFRQMITDPDYRVAMAHRQAAVLDSRLIRLAPQEPGEVFGQ